MGPDVENYTNSSTLIKEQNKSIECDKCTRKQCPLECSSFKYRNIGNNNLVNNK